MRPTFVDPSAPNDYECPDCQDRELVLERRDTGWVAKPCKCREIKAASRLIKSSGLTAAQRNVTLDQFKPGFRTNEILDVVRQYLADFPEIVSGDSYAKGIGLTGAVGVGKTHLLSAIANELLQRRVPVVFVSIPELVGELYDAQFAHDSTGLNAKINRLGQVQVVILDDVGKERITDWVQAQYYRIINQRYTMRLPTLFSSNLNMDGIADKVGDAVASRLYELTKGRLLWVDDDDYRLRGGK